MIRILDETIKRIENFLIIISATSFIVIMSIMSADVFMRYVLNSPIAWSYEALTRYLMYAAFFFAVSYTLRHGEHLRVEVIYNRMPRRPRSLILGILYLPITLLLGLAAVKATQSAAQSYHANELLAGVVHWPIWTSKAIVSIGLIVLTLRSLEQGLSLLADGFRDTPVDVALSERDNVR